MNNLWNPLRAVTSGHWIRSLRKNALWIAGGGASIGVILISCAGSGRTIMAPPTIPGAEFVGNEECATCHEKTVRDFKTADHARLMAKGKNVGNVGCESCHGPGSKHVEAGGGAGTIINPEETPQTCFQCHLDKKAEFSLPYAHPVLSGKMGCSDCHDPHKGSAIKGGGTQLHGKNETCVECHKAQTQFFIFSHDAVKEGCSSCHNPHGSVNQKMLTQRNSTLCLKCHFDSHTGTSGQMGPSGPHAPTANTSRFNQGTCWSAGCHEAVHGSNTNVELRF
jgi:predicted CXXCH cytochrome family protein